MVCVFFVFLDKHNLMNVKGVSFKTTMHLCTIHFQNVTEGAAENIVPNSSSAYAAVLGFFSRNVWRNYTKRPILLYGLIFFFFSAVFCHCQLLQNPAESLDLSFAQGSQGVWPRLVCPLRRAHLLAGCNHNKHAEVAREESSRMHHYIFSFFPHTSVYICV